MKYHFRVLLLLFGAISVASLQQLKAQTTFAYTGGSQTYTVPAGVTSIQIKAWGGGGGSSSSVTGIYGTGGGAGFVQSNLTVTPGMVLTMVVGQGGAGWNSTEGFAGATYPNGGTAPNNSGGGGGRSEVTGTGFDLIAAGGGGGGYFFNGNPGQGGAGGPLTGAAGGASPNNAGGQGGTPSSGGAGGHGDSGTGVAGSLHAGGSALGGSNPGGSGGDGFFGGGGGGTGATGVGDSGGGGGGGSNLISGSNTSSLVNTGGSGSTPGNSTDAARLTSGCSVMGNYGAGQGSTAATYRGGNGEVVVTALETIPIITSALSQSVNQGQPVSYQITAGGNPTSYAATNLPTLLTVNTTTGQITGYITQSTSVNTTISAINSMGTGTATLVWNVTPLHIVLSASVSPSILNPGQAILLTRSGSANFGIAYTENDIWPPNSGSEINLGNMQLGSMQYTPVSGAGIYNYEFMIVDIYGNLTFQMLPFTVNTSAINAPTSVIANVVGSTFVTLSWSGASGTLGVAQYGIYRNGSLLLWQTGATFTDNTAAPATAYSYTIVSKDSQGNTSMPSSPASVLTAMDFEVFTPIP